MKVKVFVKSEVDLVHKVGAYAYTFDDYISQLTNAKPFKVGIKTMTHADCMAFVNALWYLSRTAAAPEVETLEVVTDSSKVALLIELYKGEKHCEEAARKWKEEIKPLFTNLKHLNIIKSDRKGFGPADTITVLRKLKELAGFELAKMKELSV